MDAETHYLVRHALNHDTAMRNQPGENAERHSWALEFMKSTLLNDSELERYAAEMAHHARAAQSVQSPARRRAMIEMEAHYLDQAYRRAIRDFAIPEALVLVERLLSLEGVSGRDRAEALLKTSTVLRMDSRPQEAADYARKALDQAGNAAQRARATVELGNALNTAREIEQADETYQQGLRLARELNDGKLEAGVLCNLGSIRRQQGRIEESRIFLNQAVHVAVESGAREFEGLAHLHLGYLSGMQGEHDEAKNHYMAAFEKLEGTTREVFRVDASYHLGDLALQEGDAATAEQYVESALAIARRLGYRTGVSQALNIEAMVHDAAHRTEDVFASLREAIAISLESGDLLNAAMGFCNLGHNLFSEKRLDEAEEAFGKAVDAASAGRNQQAGAMAMGGLADINRARGDRMKAWTQYEHAAQLMDMVGHPPGVLRIRIRLGSVMAESGDTAQGVATIQDCIKQAEASELVEELRLAREELAIVQGVEPLPEVAES